MLSYVQMYRFLRAWASAGMRFERTQNKLYNFLPTFVKSNYRMKKHILLSLIALVGAVSALFAQEEGQGGIPADVFYLMPQMSKGAIYFKDKNPVNGSFNICAVDNTIRYKDNKGTELALDPEDNISMVVIDNVSFRNIEGVFHRMYPVKGDVFLALRRDITVMNDSHTASYGMESQTTAVSEYTGMNTDGKHYSYEESKDFPYRLSETLSIYRNGSLSRINKKSLTKCFPEKKAEIEAWFNANKKADLNSLETILPLCQQWAE